MLDLKITSWSGFSQAPIAVTLAPSREGDGPQASTKPALRLVKNDES